MVKSIDCFWGGYECVPGINAACGDCGDNHVASVFISGADRIDSNTLQALVTALQMAREEIITWQH